MPIGTICEPVDVRPDLLVRAERVDHAGAHPAPERFAHFHDAVEIVWFQTVRGELLTEQGTFAVASGVAVLIPSMSHHDFVIGPGPHRWILAHADPALVESVAAREPHRVPDQCLAVKFVGTARARMDVLFEWLLELSTAGPGGRVTLAHLTELILSEIMSQTPDAPHRAGLVIDRLDRLRPALDLVAKNPAAPPTLEAAASACHLSNAYFSRRFKFVFEMNFSDYVRIYRLRLAAQRLLSSGARIGKVAYDLGFASPAHFTALFQKRFGVSPREYRALANDRHRACPDLMEPSKRE